MKRGIKHGHLPGDIPRRYKINLLEKGYRYVPGDCDTPDEQRGIKAYKKRILMKERAVLKERTRSLIDNWNESFDT